MHRDRCKKTFQNFVLEEPKLNLQVVIVKKETDSRKISLKNNRTRFWSCHLKSNEPIYICTKNRSIFLPHCVNGSTMCTVNLLCFSLGSSRESNNVPNECLLLLEAQRPGIHRETFCGPYCKPSLLSMHIILLQNFCPRICRWMPSLVVVKLWHLFDMIHLVMCTPADPLSQLALVRDT